MKFNNILKIVISTVIILFYGALVIENVKLQRKLEDLNKEIEVIKYYNISIPKYNKNEI